MLKKVFLILILVDFVHIYNPTSFDHSQIIDFFGEVGGISFSPGSIKWGESCLYIGIEEKVYGSIMEYSCSNNDSFFI